MSQLKAGAILQIIGSSDSNTHTLYLNDGRVVRFNSVTGQVHGVVHLPDWSEIEASEKLRGG
jgi:hypothetical protein